MILGGEASRLDWIERLRALSPGCEIYNHYGPTETTVGVLTYHVGTRAPSTRSGTLPLGGPLPNARVYLLDPDGRPVPMGEQGELCIGGGVARGYLNRPELNAEKFVPDPFSAQPGARLYRTGDAVVLVREDQLVAYVAPQQADRTALREYLKERLPQYMVPSAFVVMERLPLTANGKIDRQGLAALSFESAAPARDFVAPRTETEKALAVIWSRLLKVENMGINDDVFDLGAQSLMAMKALTQIRDAFQVTLSLRNLFEHPTVAGLAEVIDGLSWLARAKAPSPAHGDREEIAL